MLRHPLRGLAAIFLVASPLVAQLSQLSGTVTDSQGKPIAGASVSVTQTSTQLNRRVKTNEAGFFSMPGLPPAIWDLTAEHPGFETARRNGLKLDTARSIDLEIALQVMHVQASIDVSTEADGPIAVNNSAQTTTIERAAIEALPLNGRYYADLALLVPGVRRGSLHLGEGNFGRESAMNVNGLPASFNNFILDGSNNNSYATSNRGFSNQVSQPSPDAIEEFTIQTSNMSAEFGRTVGATISATIRSGSNKFHGSAWEYIRNTELNAVGFFKPVQNQKPTLVRNQFGATLGGPIRRNRDFFFLDYEAIRNRSKTLSFYSVPTAEFRNGDFGVPIRNSFTGTLYSDGRIPLSVRDPFTSFAVMRFPVPNLPGTSNNWQHLNYVKDDLDKGDARLDHRFSDSLLLFGRFSAYKRSIFSPIYPDPLADPGEGNNYVLNQQGVLSSTWILRSNIVLEASYGYSRSKAGKAPLQVGAEDIPKLFGVPGYPDVAGLTGGIPTQTISGWSALGRQSTNPQFQNPAVGDPRLTLSLVKGRHNLKAGYELQFINTEVQDVNPLYGVDTYSGQFSKPTGGTASAGVYNLADFLMGARNNYQLTNYLIVNLRQRMHFGFLQDDYKVTPHLTLNLGARYEFATPQYERDNILANFDLQTQKLAVAKAGSLEDRAQVKLDRKNLAPRFGFAWSGVPKFVIRGGYGISYVHYFRRGNTIAALNGPYSVHGSVDQVPGQKDFRTTSQGFPSGFTAQDQFNPLLAGIFYFDRSGATPYVQSWNLSVQRALPLGVTLEAAWVGNHGLKFPSGNDINSPNPNAAGQNLIPQARRPLQSWSSITVQLPIGDSTYNSLQVKAERRFSRGLQLLNSFTWSRTMDNYCGPQEAPNNCGLQDWRSNLNGEWSVSSLDQPWNNVTSIVWQLPFGKKQRWLSKTPAAINSLLGGWRLTAISQAHSGEVINLIYTPSTQFNVGVTQRPNVIGSIYPAERSINRYFDPTTVVIPTDPTKPFGNAGRNLGRSDATFTTDLGLHKSFSLPGEKAKMDLRAESFNVFNRTNFAPANGDRASGAFGTIRSTFAPRRLQVSLRLAW